MSLKRFKTENRKHRTSQVRLFEETFQIQSFCFSSIFRGFCKMRQCGYYGCVILENIISKLIVTKLRKYCFTSKLKTRKPAQKET